MADDYNYISEDKRKVRVERSCRSVTAKSESEGALCAKFSLRFRYFFFYEYS